MRIAVAIFGLVLFYHDIQQNISSWASWAILDVFMTLSAWQAGNKKPFLQAFYSLASIGVVIAIFRNGYFHFGLTEAVCLGGTVGAVYVWRKIGPGWATLFGAVVMDAAGIPCLLDSLAQPDWRTFWLWGTCAFSGILTVCLIEDFSIRKPEQWAFAGLSAIFNIAMTIIVLA